MPIRSTEERFKVDNRSSEFEDLLSGVQDRAEGTELEFPEFDRARVSGLTQSYLNPQIETLRRIGRENIISAGSSPFARAYATRQNLRGIGEAIPGVQVGATKSALGEYLPEYEGELEKARLGFEGSEARRADDLSALVRLYGQQRDEIYTRPEARESAVTRDATSTPSGTVPKQTAKTTPTGYKGRFAGMDTREFIMAKGREEGLVPTEIAQQLRDYDLAKSREEKVEPTPVPTVRDKVEPAWIDSYRKSIGGR